MFSLDGTEKEKFVRSIAGYQVPEAVIICSIKDITSNEVVQIAATTSL